MLCIFQPDENQEPRVEFDEGGLMSWNPVCAVSPVVFYYMVLFDQSLKVCLHLTGWVAHPLFCPFFFLYLFTETCALPVFKT